MKERKWILISGLFILGLVLAVLIIGKNREPAEQEFLIGAILPMTGSVGFEGERVSCAMQMATEEMNDMLTNRSVKLIVEDGKWSAKETITAYNRLITKNVNAIIVFGDTPCLVIDEVAKKNTIPVFCISGVSSLITGNDNFVQCSFPALKPVSEVAKYALKQSLKRTAIVHLNEPLCSQTVSGFRESYQRGGGSIVATEKFDWNQYDTKSLVSKILQYNTDAVFVFGYGPSYISVLNQIKTQGYRGCILTDLNVVAVAADLLDRGDGIIYGDVDFGMESSNTRTRKFISSLKQRYGVEANAFAAFSYEAVRLCSISAAKSDFNSAEIIGNITKVRGYDSLLGFINYNENRELDLPVLIKKCNRNGTATVLE